MTLLTRWHPFRALRSRDDVDDDRLTVCIPKSTRARSREVRIQVG